MIKKVFDDNSLIWFNDQFIPYHKADFVHVASHSLHYASSIFEGIVAFDGKVFSLKRHIKRFFKSAQTLGMKIKFTEEELIKATNLVIQENHYTDGLYYMRPIAWRDVEDATIKGYQDAPAHIAIMARKHTNSINNINLTPVNLLLSSWKKAPANCTPHQCKGSGNYTVSILAKQEARNNKLDDALLLDCDGFIAEAGSANSFFIKDKTIYTPNIQHCLNGITRQTVIMLARKNHYTVEECNILPDQIERFDEAFLTGTAVGILSVNSVKLSTKTTKEFKQFDVAQKLKQEYQKEVQSYTE